MDKKLQFIEDYKKSKNASSGSKYDSNANVTTKNVATLTNELGKKDLIKLNRAVTCKNLTPELATQFLMDLSEHIIYSHDESSIFPYCCSISLYPFILNGLKDLGGMSDAPKHANSFIGGLSNLIFLVAGQFAGAVAIPEFLTYFDHFLRKDFGDNYLETHSHDIEDWFQQLIYTLNEPASARGYQSCFTNIAYFDKYYFESIFKDFIFPDGDEPNWETTKELQKFFMKWFNNERTKTVLTFPVETANLLVENGKYKDEEMADFFADMWAKGHSFFCYQSDSVDSLASCCRLRNGIEENAFSYTLGAGGIMTGSKKVITLNINRIVQDWYIFRDFVSLPEYIANITKRVHKYLEAYNKHLWDLYDSGLLTIYKSGFIDLDKQYLTVGINGFVEAAEFLGIDIKFDNPEYKQFAKDILETIKNVNKEDGTEHCRFNTEMVPAENLGVKHYNWDKQSGYLVPSDRNCYNSYFYKVEDNTCDPVQKLYLQGEGFTTCLDGGAACHINLDEHLSKAQYRKLMEVAVKAGCNYFTFNVPNTICNVCGHISKNHLHHCEKCGSEDVDYVTRIIGYLRRISNFSEARQEEAKKRYYAKISL